MHETTGFGEPSQSNESNASETIDGPHRPSLRNPQAKAAFCLIDRLRPNFVHPRSHIAEETLLPRLRRRRDQDVENWYRCDSSIPSPASAIFSNNCSKRENRCSSSPLRSFHCVIWEQIFKRVDAVEGSRSQPISRRKKMIIAGSMLPRAARVAGAFRHVGAAAMSSAASEPIKVGIIGAGRIGQVHAETLAYRCPDATAVRIVDFFPDVAAATAKKYGIASSGTDYMDIVNDDSISAVWICSPSSMHAEQIVAAARKGKHIFCEKPLATELKQVDDVIKVVQECGVKMMLAFQRRFDPNFARARKAVDDGTVGDPYTFHLTSRDPAPPPVDYILKSGGLHNDMAIHDFDIARFLMKSECVKVTAVGACRVDPKIGSEGGDIDTAMTLLEFENGAFGVVDNCRKSPQGYDQRVEVFGSKGQVSFSNNFPNALEIADDTSVRRDLPLNFFMDRYMDAYRNETIQFVDAVVNDKTPPTSGHDGRAAMVIALAAKKSLQEGRPVLTSEIQP